MTKRGLTIGLMSAAMASVGPATAFAAAPDAAGLPGQEPGPNSFVADPLNSPRDPATGSFGQCQSQLAAQQPGSASLAQIANPAIYTAGEGLGLWISCPRS